jgi:D-aspartate ligase
MDKARFQAIAQELGFAIPRAVHLARPGDLAASDALDYPCVLKPVVKTPGYDKQFKKAYKVDSPQQLRGIFADIDGAAEMIAQEWIDGGDDRIYFCLQYRASAERPVASFTGRKLRSWPPRTGGTASCVPAPEFAETLTGLTDAFFAAVGCIGFASMEFKLDARTGQFLMIEPTVGRTDFQEEIATLNGVNIPYSAYCSLLGRAVPAPCPSSPPAAWSLSQIDRWSSELQPEGARGFPAAVRRYDALWRMDDPLPWCYTRAANLKSRLLGWKRLPRR